MAIILFAMPGFAQPVFTDRIPVVLPTTQKVEQADYNFDGFTDYRIGTVKPSAKFDYFIYNRYNSRYEKDTLLSSMDGTTFEPQAKIFSGYKLTRLDSLTVQTDVYLFRNGVLVPSNRSVCRSPFIMAERIDCTYYEWQNGAWVFKEFVQGDE